MRRQIEFVFLMCIGIWIVSGNAVLSQIVVVPPSLSPGSQYRIVFVTSATRDATSINIAAYNSFVSNVANSQPLLAALGTNWTAIASTQTIDARDNTNTNWSVVGEGVPFYRLDGLRVAPHNSYFWNMAFPENTISFTELGTRTPITVQSSTMGEAPWVWAGTTSGGIKSTGYLGVNSGSSANFPVAAVAWDFVTGPYSWLGLATTPILDVHPLYGMSGILTVPTSGIPGDFDLDGDVDGRDFLAWQRGNSPNGTPGGPVSAADLADWQNNYGAGSLIAESTAVPEPGCWLLFALAALPGIVWRR